MRIEDALADVPASTDSPGAATLPVSVVIPVFNRSDMLARALDSAWAQLPGPPAEVIVVDDASTDGSADVAERMGAHVLRHGRNRGESAARNTAIEAATQPWIALLDSDDEWLPHHLATLWRLRADHVLVATSVLRRGADRSADRFHGPVTREPLILRSPAHLIYPHNFVANSALMMRRETVRAVGGYREDLRRAEDLDLSVRLLERGTGVASPEVGALWHLHAGQQTTNDSEGRAAHRAIAAAARARPWCSEALLERTRGACAWDDLRSALSAGRRSEALRQARTIVADPHRVLGVAGLLAWRYLGRRRSRDLATPARALS